MNRRTFLSTVASATMARTAAGAAGQANAYFLLQHYYMRNGTQPARIHEFLRGGLLPALARVHNGPRIFLEALVAAHMPQVAVLVGLKSFDEWTSIQARLNSDAAYQKTFAAWEIGAEPPFDQYAQILLKATDYTPAIEDSPRDAKSRVFELRTYHSPTWRQLAALHRRFSGPEIRIFHRSGIHPILYSETTIGPNMPNLTYLTPFADLSAREKAWSTFQADPEWVKVRRESVEADGQVSNLMQISLFRSTEYSPVK